jgi:phage-related tail fiber protein
MALVKISETSLKDESMISIVGHVISYADGAAPTGYLKCNGAAISRTTYVDLFNLIGTTFGVGDTTTTFNLPDLRGEFIRGYDDGAGVDSGRVFASFQDEVSTYVDAMSRANVASLTAVDVPPTGWSSYLNHFDNITDRCRVQNYGYEMRPRNYALLYCIKY